MFQRLGTPGTGQVMGYHAALEHDCGYCVVRLRNFHSDSVVKSKMPQKGPLPQFQLISITSVRLLLQVLSTFNFIIHGNMEDTFKSSQIKKVSLWYIVGTNRKTFPGEIYLPYNFRAED